MGNVAVDLDAWRNYVLTAVRQIGTALAADDDWMPTLLLDTPDGLGIMPLEGRLAEHGALPQISAVIVQRQATHAARVQMSWQLDDPEANRRALLGIGPTPSKHPDRVEHVTVHIGTGHVLEAWDATVTRGEVGLTLSDWKRAEPGGPVAESMRAALAVATRRN